MSVPILGPPTVRVLQAQVWAASRGATWTGIWIAQLYWEEAPKHGGVRPEVAYAQAMKETGFFRFGGVLDASFYNPCGLKTPEGGANEDPGAHTRFHDWDCGVIAHLQHLALYAGADGFPVPEPCDPRHFPYLHGVAPDVVDLGGRWAPAPEYGPSLLHGYLDPLLGHRF
jgi:N-acetylmuramoyl-L-alanine amidase